jgi:hypothetical protein
MRSLALVALSALPLPGCVVVAAGAAGYGTAQILRNSDDRDHAGALPVVWAAALASAREAGYPVALDTPPGPSGATVSVNDLTLTAWPVADKTRVRVRIGTFSTDAHRAMSARIHDGIAARVAP